MKKQHIIFLGIIILLILALFFANKKFSNGNSFIYRNKTNAFEIKLKNGTESKISIDTADGGYPSFWGNFYYDNTTLLIRMNEYSEATPIIPSEGVLCEMKVPISLFGKNIEASVFSSATNSNSATCGDHLLSEHTVFLQKCIGKNVIYKPENPHEEVPLVCEDNDNFFDIELACSGDQWAGLSGMNKCIEIFQDYINNFKVL